MSGLDDAAVTASWETMKGMGKAEARGSIDLHAAYRAARDMTEHLGMSKVGLFGTISFKVVDGRVVDLDVTQKLREADLQRSHEAEDPDAGGSTVTTRLSTPDAPTDT